MSKLTYTNYTNLDAHFVGVYERGQRLVKGWTGEFPPCFSLRTDIPFSEAILGLAERIFAIHNRDDRPDGRLCPSLSVGDVVVIGETALSVASVGFVEVTLDPADLITDRTWAEVA